MTVKVEEAPAVPDEATSTEASALLDIIEWSKDCPPWQRDALRRLCMKEDLEEGDIAELTDLIKDSSTAIPINPEHVRDAAAANLTIALERIHSIRNVNALAEGEELTFAKAGITLLYGDNGSGKSGYARVLKKVCRARSPRGETVLPNIYATSNNLPSAVIDFCVNGEHRSAGWVSNVSVDPALSGVSVFDSRTANVHVDQTNDVAYTPVPLRVLAGLALVCQEVKQQLNAEIEALERQRPAAISSPPCRPTTRVGRLISDLLNANAEEVLTLADVTESEKVRLASLKTDLAADPARVSRQLLGQKARLDAGLSRMETLIGAADDSNVGAIRQASKQLKIARSAAQAASTRLFAGEPLPEIGSEVWRELWEAARHFSESSAYPGNAFPFTGDSSRCVLCLQELHDPDAKRLNNFEAFVKDESKVREAEAQGAFERLIAGLKSAEISDVDREALSAFIENDLGDRSLAEKVSAAILDMMSRITYVRENPESDSISIPMPDAPVDLMRALSKDLQRRASAVVADGHSQAHKDLVAEHDDLADRAWLMTIKDDVISEIGRRKNIAGLQRALKDTATNRVTTKSAEFAETLVTNALRARFAKEVAKLGIAGLAVELRQEKTSQGVPLFRVSLINKPDQRAVGEVLSEGEHRCVALAAFLAEVATTSSRSGLVFDDPVSSLDHMHREAVASRLAEEGKDRQVIIFTHDISFLVLLYEECRQRGTHIAFRCISRGSQYAGYCQSNPPPTAQPVEKVIQSMRKHLENTKVQFERGQQEEWYRTVKLFKEELRFTWERAVEDVVSVVIKRLSNKVDTKGLSKLTVLTIEDCKVMRAAYGRSSELLHSAAETLNKPLPPPSAIDTEISALETWLTDISSRQEKVKMV
jgi:energy-coupling factor transporter ATP-binding protein EcfA2